MNPNHRCWTHGHSAGRKVGMRQLINKPKTLQEVLDDLCDPDGYEKFDTTAYIYSVTDDYIIDQIIRVEEAIRILKIEQL